MAASPTHYLHVRYRLPELTDRQTNPTPQPSNQNKRGKQVTLQVPSSGTSQMALEGTDSPKDTRQSGLQKAPLTTTAESWFYAQANRYQDLGGSKVGRIEVPDYPT